MIQYPPTPIPNTWPPEYRNNKQNCVEFGNSIPYLPDFDGLCNRPEIRLEVQPHNEPGLPQSFNPDNYSFPYYGPIPNINNPADCIQENSDPNGMPVQNCLTVKMIFTIEPCDGTDNCDPFEFEALVQFCCDCKEPLPFLPPYSHD